MTTALNYSNFDFDDLVQTLQNRLKNRGAWADIYRSGTGEMLIEFLAYVGQLTLFYTERRAQESFLDTAQLRSSVVNLVSLLNYQPKRKTSATGNLTFTLASPRTAITLIPKYTNCESTDGFKFLTNEASTIERGGTTATVSCIQGQLVQKQIASDGSVEQEYLVNDAAVENSADTANPTFRVLVDSEEWALVTSFLNSSSTAKEYRIINEMEGTVSVRFGDNVNGMAPGNGSTIVVQYIRTGGLNGNVSTPGKVTTISSTIYDSDNAAVTDLTVTNAGAFLGGDDEEDIEEIRYEAPRVFKTGERAVTRDDFIALLEGYAGVACVNVWGENEEAAAAGVSVDYTMLNKVKIAMILQDWALPDATFQTTVGTWIYNKSMLTVKYEWVTPVILEVVPTLRVTVATGYSLTQTQTDVTTALEAQFLLGTTTRLGTLIKYSQVLSAIHDLESVAYVTMDLEIKKDLSSSYLSVYDWGATLDALEIKPETTRVFIDDTHYVTDVDQHDGTGTFTLAGVQTVTGTINYTTGVVLINATPTGSAAYVRYQQNQNGNIVPTLTQIAKLSDDGPDFVSISMES